MTNCPPPHQDLLGSRVEESSLGPTKLVVEIKGRVCEEFTQRPSQRWGEEVECEVGRGNGGREGGRGGGREEGREGGGISP